MHVAALPAFANAAANRYNTLLYAALERSGATIEEFVPRVRGQHPVDIVHLHWPDSPLNKRNPVKALGRGGQLLASVAAAKRKGAHVVWTAHNAETHWRRYPRLERMYWSLLDRMLDGWVALSPATVDAVIARHPTLARTPYDVIPHGHYRGAYPDDVDKLAARGRLDLPAGSRVVAMVGRIKPYKGADRLIAAFRDLPDPELRLLIAGRCDDDELGARLPALAAGDDRIVLQLHEIADDDLQLWLRAADLTVLPYVDVLNSGSALLALSFDLPVLAPDAGGFRDLATALPSWVRTFSGSLLPADIEAALAVLPAGQPDLTAFDWDPIAAQTLAFYSRVATA